MGEHAPPERVALLIVRVWVTEARPGPLRARITEVRDVATGERVVATASSREAIEEAVSRWLRQVTAG